MTRLFTYLGGPALAVAALLTSAPAALAQHHGGGHSGGAYTGGYHGGGMGGYHGGYGAYHGGYGGYYGHGYYPYYGRGYGYGYPGFGLYLGLGGLGYGGYGGYYGGGYGGYSDGGYAYAPSYYNYPQNYVAPDYSGVTQSGYTPSGGTAQIVIHAPADAQVWVENYQVNQTGPVRHLTTPPTLEPGKSYHYVVKATWTQNGQPVTQERAVNFQAGQSATMDFSQPAPVPPPPSPVTPPTQG